MKYKLSRHARQEMERRKISQEMVEQGTDPATTDHPPRAWEKDLPVAA